MSSNHAIVQPLSEDLLSCVKEMITHLSKNKDKNRTLHKQSLSTATPPPTTSTAYAFDSGLAKSIFGKNIKENDLTVVEGIGPKIQELFHKNNIKTWKSLSNCSVQKCQSILDDAGEAYRTHNPGTWPKQARMAYEGKWEKLLKGRKNWMVEDK